MREAPRTFGAGKRSTIGYIHRILVSVGQRCDLSVLEVLDLQGVFLDFCQMTLYDRAHVCCLSGVQVLKKALLFLLTVIINLRR